MSIRRWLMSVGFVVALLLPGQIALAAPQILGVMATNGARPMSCKDGTCVPYLETFCIQRQRDVPGPGASYHPAPGAGGVTLVITTGDANTLRLPAADTMRFTGFGGYAAAAEIFDRPGAPESDAARLTGTLINALPETGRVGAAERDGLWRRIAAGGTVEGLSRVGVARAKLGYRVCRSMVARGVRFTIRQCLVAGHEHLMLDMNGDYWNRLGAV